MSFVLQLGSGETLEETTSSVREIASVTIQEKTTEPMSIVLQLGTATATTTTTTTTATVNSKELDNPEKSTAMVVTKPAIVYPSNQVKFQQNASKSNVTTAVTNVGGVIAAVAKPGTIVYPAKAIKDQKISVPAQTSVDSKIIAAPLILTQQQVPSSTTGTLIPCTSAGNNTTPVNPLTSKPVINSTANSNLTGKVQLTYEVIPNKQQQHQHSSGIIQSTASQKVVSTAAGVKTITSTSTMSNIQRLRNKSPSATAPNSNVHKVKTITSINNQGMVTKNFTPRVQAVSKAQTLSTNVAITPVTMTQVITNSSIQRLQQNNQQKIQQNQSSNQTVINSRVNANHKVPVVQQPIDQTQALQKVAGVFPKTLAVQRQQVASTGVNNVQNVQKVSIAGIQKTSSVPQNQPQNNTVHYQNSQQQQQPKSQITSLQKSQTALVLNNSPKNSQFTNVSNIVKSSSIPNVSKIQANSAVALSKGQLISQSQVNVHHTVHVQQMIPQSIQGQAVSKQQQQSLTLQTARVSANSNSQQKLNVIQQNATLTSIPINQKNPLVVNAKVQSQPQMLLKVGPMKNSSINSQHTGNMIKTVGQKANAVSQVKTNPQQVGLSLNRAVNAQPVKIIQQQQSPQQHIVVNQMTSQKQPGCIKTMPAQKVTTHQQHQHQQQQQQQHHQQQRNNAQKVGGIKTSLNTNMNSLKAQTANNTSVPVGNALSQKTNLRNFHPQQLNTSNIMIQKNQTMKIQQQNIQQKQIIMPPQYPQSQNIRPQGGQIKTILPIVSPDTHKEMETKMGQEIQMKKEPESQEQPTSPARRMPLPYECLQFVLQDHNYGAPPPRTPPPASPPPHPQQQPLNGASGSTLQHSFIYNQVITNNNTADDAASAISSDGGREVEPEGEETETAPEGEGDEEDSVTRCICDFEHDDGYMICCDRCLVWQHVDCMGIDRSNIPDEYLCEICRPRRVDRQRARTLQLRKREELLNSDTSSETSSNSSTDTDVGSNNPPAKKRQLQQLPVPRRKSDPPPSTLRKLNNNNNNNNNNNSNSNNNNNNNNNNVAKRQRREQLPRQASAGRKKETAKRGPGKRKTKRRISLDGEDETQDAWGSNMAPLRQWIERYEEAVTNHYSPELRARISSIKVNGTHSDLKQSNMSSGVSGKCRINVQSNSLRFLVATVYLPPNTPIIELRGKYMLSTQHRSSYPQGRQHAQRPGPFVFFYRLPREGTEVCVDTRTYGNDARFVRRSCKPNAEIKHCIEKGTLHLYIVTIAAIEKSNEITIRHEQHDLLLSPNTNLTGSTPLPCACGNPRTCQITTTTGQLSSSRRSNNGTLAENVDGRERRRRGRRNTVSEENDVSGLTTSSTPSVTSQSTPNRTPTPTSSTSTTPTVSAGAKKMITNTVAPVPTSTVTTTAVPVTTAAATSTATLVTASTTMTTTTSVIVTTTTSSSATTATATATATAVAVSTITTATTTSTSAVVTAAMTKVLPKEEAPVLASQPPTQQVVHSTPQTAPTSQETSKKDKKKMTREERKMEAIMKAFERLEKAEQRKQEVQARNAQRKESGGAHSDNDDLPLSLPTRPKQQHIERPLRRKRRKGRARTTSSSQSQNNRRTRLNSADSDMSSGDESIMMQSPPSSCIPNREAPFSPRLHTPTKDENCVEIAEDSNNQTIPAAAADILLALANSNIPGPSSPPLQQPPPSKSPTCDSGASSSSQSSTPSTPLSSACLLVAAAVGPLAPGFKFPKTKKAMMNEWLRDSPDTPQAHVQIPSHISPNMSIASVPSPSPVISSTTRSIDFLSPTDPSPEFLTQSYAAKSLATLVQAANSVSGICDSPPQRKQAVAQNANGCPVSSGSAKKRWLRQAISEECDSPNSRPESPPSEMVAPPKKRRIARESISSDNYTPPTTPTPVHTEAGPTNSALTLSENDFCEQPHSPLSMERRIKTDYEADTMKEDTNSESEKPEFFEAIKTKPEVCDSEIKDHDRGSDKINVSVKDEVDLIKSEVKINIKDELMEIDEDNHDILTSVNLTKVKVKPDIKSQESLDVIKPSDVPEYPIKRESSSPLNDEKCSMEIANQSDLETDEPKSPVIAMESDIEAKQSSVEMTLTYSQTAIVNQTFENLEKDCKSNDASSIDEFDVEAQMKMITGDDGNDYKEKVDTCSDKDYKSMDGIEGLMDSSKEDSDSEDRDIEDLQPKEEPRRFKELERAVEERAFKELETMSYNQEFKPSGQVFLTENLDTRLKSPETTKLESTTTTTTSEESMFDSVSSNIDCESAVVEPPKIFQSIPPLSERIRKKPDSSAVPKKSLVFEAAMIESTIDMESVEIAENGDDKNQLSTALREILRSKIDEEPTPFMNAENTDPPLENINPSPEDINPPLESINPSPEDLDPPINSLSKDIYPSPKETSHSSPNKANLSPINVNLSTKEIKLSPKNLGALEENINSSESINPSMDDSSTPLDNLYPALEKMSPPSENFNSLLENTSPPVLNHIEAIVSEPSVPENLPTVPATKEEIIPAKVEEKVLPPPPPQPEIRRLKDPRTAVPNRCPSPKHDTPAPVKRKLSISEYRKRKQQSTETPPEPEPSSDVASSDKSPRGRSDSASSGTSSLSSDDDNAKTGHDIPSLTSLPLFANSENDERKGNEEGVIGWSAAPTLVERQRENLTERLKREFGLFLSDDEEERARKQGLTAEAILKARKEAMPNQIPMTVGPTPYTSSQLPPQTYIPPPGSAAIHYPQFQVKPGMPGPYVMAVPQPIPPPLPPPGIYPVPAPTVSTLLTVGKTVPPQFLVPQAPPGANPYPPQFIPATSPPATTPRFPVSTPTPVPPPPGFTPTPPPQKPYYSHPPPAPRT